MHTASAQTPRSFFKRLFLTLTGGLLLVVGAAGLVLPGIQGVLTLVAGAALLSIVSPTVRQAVRTLFQRWPRGWRRYLRIERRLQQLLKV